MNDQSIDQETRDAINALVWRLENREAGTSDEVLAQDFILALRGKGWRPTEARKAPDWRPRHQGAGAAPNENFRNALDEVRAKAAASAEGRRKAAREVPLPSPLSGHSLEAS